MKYKLIEEGVEDISGIKCVCGCGMEASQIYKGLPIPNVNPMLHYRTYIRKVYGIKEECRLKLQVSPLEHMTSEQAVQARRGQ